MQNWRGEWLSALFTGVDRCFSLRETRRLLTRKKDGPLPFSMPPQAVGRSRSSLPATVGDRTGRSRLHETKRHREVRQQKRLAIVYKSILDIENINKLRKVVLDQGSRSDRPRQRVTCPRVLDSAAGLSWFKKILVLSPDRRFDCKCYKMFTFSCPTFNTCSYYVLFFTYSHGVVLEA